MSNYTNPKDGFHPTTFINLAHSISKSNFATSNNYMVSVVTVPGVLSGLGLLSLICFGVGVLMRLCPVACFCCKCYPGTNPRDNDEKKAQSVQCQRRGVLTFFYMFLIVSLTANQLSFIGNANIALAVSEFDTAIVSIQVGGWVGGWTSEWDGCMYERIDMGMSACVYRTYD